MNSHAELGHKRTMSREMRISSPEELYPLLSKFTLTGLRTGYVVLDIHWLNEEENIRYSGQVNKHYKACGCSEGTVAGLIGVVVGTAFFFFGRWYWSSLSTTMSVMIATGVVFGFMTVGKIYGLLQAKRKLYQTILEISKTKV